MKHVWNHPAEPTTGRKYWRSLGQLAKTPASTEWLDREFRDGAAELKTEAEVESSRRSFMKLMGASTALAGLASCRRPELHLLPYAKGPEWGIPGKVLFFTTAIPRVGGGTAVIVHSHENRPTHLQGNSHHPEGIGLDGQSQASVLDLYDPSRTKEYFNFQKPAKEAAFFSYFDAKKADLAKNQGQGLAILLDGAVTPTRDRLAAEVLKTYPQAKLYRYEAFGDDHVRAAYSKAFGPGAAPAYHFEKSDRVFSLDCDFMGQDRIGGSSTADFMARRKADTPEDGPKMARLYAAEARFSLTGGLADHRLRVHASQTFKFAVDLAKALASAAKSPELAAAANAAKLTGAYDHPRKKDFQDTQPGDQQKSFKADYDQWVSLAAKDLASKRGTALVTVGLQHPEALQSLVIAMNQALHAYGSVITVHAAPQVAAGSLAALATAAASKSVDTLIIIGDTDPVFEAAPDLLPGGLPAALAQVPNILVHTRRPRTATARLATWIIPATHYLEQWGDTRSFGGHYSIVQPMIEPLFQGCVSDIALLQALISNQPAAPQIAVEPVRATFNALIAGASDDLWNTSLRDGVTPKSVYAAVGSYNPSAVASSIAAGVDTALAPGQWEVSFIPCAKIHDGRYINNGWLQEAPDPVSKATWDNVALISVKSARELGINLFNEDSGDVISVEINGAKRYFPVLVIPGHVDNNITLTVGYGQKEPGLVGHLSGFDAYVLRSAQSPGYSVGAQVQRLTEAVTGDALKGIADRKEIPAVYPLGLTAEHHSMFGRAIVREGTVKDWSADKDFVLTQGTDGHLHASDREGKEALNKYSFYKPKGLAGKDGVATDLLHDTIHQWGMVIDLNKCTGCNSCLLACQSENNIPIVGKDQVIRGREMHWIRMDRYFATDLNSDAALNNREVEPDAWNEDQMDEPEMLVMPVGCQQCEAAPCETVCPVNATVHSPDGLNLMVYNRCIGTRYCANNCPFKARRFNFFDYNKRNPLVKVKINVKVDTFEFGNLYAGPVGERHDSGLSALQKNPAVSVRMRGVIEKCTYCLQRIETSRAAVRGNVRKAKMLATGKTDETLTFEDSEFRTPTDSVKTACQESCPAEAIAFGNILDDKSTVSAWKRNSRNYEMLGYLNVRARTTYLARIKNPNPELMDISGLEKSKVGEGSRSRHVHAHRDSHAPAGH